MEPEHEYYRLDVISAALNNLGIYRSTYAISRAAKKHGLIIRRSQRFAFILQSDLAQMVEKLEVEVSFSQVEEAVQKAHENYRFSIPLVWRINP